VASQIELEVGPVQAITHTQGSCPIAVAVAVSHTHPATIPGLENFPFGKIYFEVVTAGCREEVELFSTR
jgi:hypothetical protein